MSDLTITVESEECIVHESSFVENIDGSISFDARISVRLAAGTREWIADKVIRCRATKSNSKQAHNNNGGVE